MNKFKLFTIVLGTLLLASVTSCTKDNPQDNPQNGGGTYNPEKKIQKIYMTDKYHEEKVLLETWHWNGNKLESIDYYNIDYYKTQNNQIYGVERFTYDENRLTRIDYDENEYAFYNTDQYSLFNYEKNVLASIDHYSYSNTTQTFVKGYTITFAYQDDKLSQVVVNKANWTNSQIWQLTWDGDNLTSAVYNDGTGGYWFEYDNNNNPMKGRPYLLFPYCLTGSSTGEGWDYFGSFLSKNNCTKMIQDMHKDGTFHISYLYDEDGYPTKQMRGASAYYYEYE